ncbi:hypothetical protein SDRG_05639 [Saprolegnia diclina VS20]|uniref:Uncharacterized protein n=1 Tax=Saprolegnia diclina (strain VS20) TaxID=1156394 RepID=T0S209_SAPDV|nr:hypothetical protein SDRG_05639 [Saprolegnia diclina VS20]EQC36807.1 hypothetical protein SDRG_05639 [Saprolegnia diclina VS20]|eukprot:XP_008609588.1 hypothetical protein SDRG_05639 [Saprolegnia diclina VS20]
MYAWETIARAREAFARARKAGASPSEGLEKAMELFQQPGPIYDFRALVQELQRLVETSDVSTMDAFLHLATVVPHQDCTVRAKEVGHTLVCLALALGGGRTTATVVCTLVGAILTNPRTAVGFVSAFTSEWGKIQAVGETKAGETSHALIGKYHTWVRTCYRPLVQPIIMSSPLESAQEFIETWTIFATMQASYKDKSGAADSARTALDVFCDPRTNAEARSSMAGSMHELLGLLNAVDAQRVATIIVEETLLHASPRARTELLSLLEHLVQDGVATPQHFVMVCHLFATATVPDEQSIWLALFRLWIEVATKATSHDAVLPTAYLIPPLIQRHAVASIGSFATAALLDAANKYAYNRRCAAVDAVTISPNEAGVMTLRCHTFAFNDLLATLPAPSGAYDAGAVLTAASALVAFGWVSSDELVAYLDTCAHVWPEARGIVTPCFLYMASVRYDPTVFATLLNIPAIHQCTYCSKTPFHPLAYCAALKIAIQEKRPLRKGAVVTTTFDCSYCRYLELLEATGHVAPASTPRLASPKFHREHSCNALLQDIADGCVRVGYVYPAAVGPPKGWVNYLAGKFVVRKHPGKQQRKARERFLASTSEANLDTSSEPRAKRQHMQKATTDDNPSPSYVDPTRIDSRAVEKTARGNGVAPRR